MSTAIRDASVSLRTLLENRLRLDPDVRGMLPPGALLNISLNTPEEMAQTNEQGISLWLYRIVRDEFRLNARPTRVPPDRLRIQPLPLRLHYLVTPVFQRAQGVAAPELEQTLLGKVAQVFHEEATLVTSDLVGTLADGGVELTVRLESLNLDDVTRVWDALERSYQLCLSYEVGIVPVASRREVAAGPPVLVLAHEVGVATELQP